MDTKTKHQPDADSPLIPGVDYDVLTPEEHAAELAQPDPAAQEAWFIEAGKDLPDEITPEMHIEITPEEGRRILGRFVDEFSKRVDKNLAGKKSPRPNRQGLEHSEWSSRPSC